MLISKFAIGHSSDPSTSHSRSLFRQDLPQSYVRIFHRHLPCNRFLSDFAARPVYSLILFLSNKCAADCNVLDFTILPLQITNFLCDNRLSKIFGFSYTAYFRFLAICSCYGRAMTQVISCQVPTSQDRVLSKAILYWICGQQTGTGTCLSASTSVVLCQYYCTNAPWSFIYHQCDINLATDSVVK